MNLLPADPLGFMRPDADPRATLIADIDEGLPVQLWMGGANAARGVPLSATDLHDAVLVDCAGELPPRLRAAAARVIPFVFPDLEAVPQRYARLLALADDLARFLQGQTSAADPGPSEAAAPKRRLYVLCQQGMNRSALITGLTLRAAGFRGEETLALLRARRPGCLTNLTYAGLIDGSVECLPQEPPQ